MAEEKENLFRQLRAKSTDSTSFRKQQSEIDKLKQQLKEKEGMLTCTQEELASVKESLEQLQNILQQEKGQEETAVTSTHTEVEYESRGTSMQQQDQGTQAEFNNQMLEQLKQNVNKIKKLEGLLEQKQEENKQLKQKATQNAGVDASSSTDQRETKEVEVQTDVQMNDFHDLYNEKGEYVKTEFSNPNAVPAEGPEKSSPLSKG